MFLRVMVAVGVVALVLALFMFTRVSPPDTPPLSAKPLGASTLSHGAPPTANPSTGLVDRHGDGMRNQDSEGEMK